MTNERKLRFFNFKYILPGLTSGRGFTLLELLFAISIIILLLAVSIPLLRAPSENNKLILASEEVKEGILRVHSLSLAPHKDKLSESQFYVIKFGQSLAADVSEGFLISERYVDENGASADEDFEKFDFPDGIDFASEVPVKIKFSIEQQGKIVELEKGTEPPISSFDEQNKLLEINLNNKVNSTQKITLNLITGTVEVSNLKRR